MTGNKEGATQDLLRMLISAKGRRITKLHDFFIIRYLVFFINL